MHDIKKNDVEVAVDMNWFGYLKKQPNNQKKKKWLETGL